MRHLSAVLAPLVLLGTTACTFSKGTYVNPGSTESDGLLELDGSPGVQTDGTEGQTESGPSSSHAPEPEVPGPEDVESPVSDVVAEPTEDPNDLESSERDSDDAGFRDPLDEVTEGETEAIEEPEETQAPEETEATEGETGPVEAPNDQVAEGCSPTFCQNGGACSGVGPSRVCDCSGTGYQGTSCGDDVDECASSPCDPLTVCVNTPGSFSCSDCPEGYTGNGATGCVNVNECLTNNGGCDALTTCSDTPGSRICGPCPAGFSGTGATGCTNIDDCSPNPCRNGGTCADGIGSYTCSCVGPWSGSICGSATLTVNATARGSYTSMDWFILTGTTIAGRNSDFEYRAYFVFPVPSFTGTVDSVTLRLEHDTYSSTDSEERFTVSDVSTPIGDLVALDQGDALAIFQDLGSGTQYGTFTLTQNTTGTIRSILLSGAVSSISNAGGSDFAIGVRSHSLSAGYEQLARFSFDVDVRTQQLQIVVVP